MIGLLLLTHGGVAEELVSAAKKIVKDPGNLSAIAIEWDQGVEEARTRVSTAILELDQGQGVIVATDMFGGTPTNIALTFLERGRVEVVTGINLPMVIKFTNLPHDVDLSTAARTLADRGRASISVAGVILDHKSEPGA